MQHIVSMTLGLIWGSSAVIVAALCFFELGREKRNSDVESERVAATKALETATRAWQRVS